MPNWTTDEELFSLCRRELFPALMGNVMDAMGYVNQFLPLRSSPCGTTWW